MKKEDQFITVGPFITSSDMARKLNVSESYIVTLCFHDLLLAIRHEKYGWLIYKDCDLPCVLEFKNVSDDINHKILRGEYEVSYMETCYSWTQCLLENTEYVEFQNICIEEMMCEDNDEKLDLKYVVTKEQFLQVASWKSNFERFLSDVDYALPNDSYIVGVFDNKTEAYVYAWKMFDEINLMDKRLSTSGRPP